MCSPLHRAITTCILIGLSSGVVSCKKVRADEQQRPAAEAASDAVSARSSEEWLKGAADTQERKFATSAAAHVPCTSATSEESTIRQRVGDADAGLPAVALASISCNCTMCRIELEAASADEKLLVAKLVRPGGVLSDLFSDVTYIRMSSRYTHGRIFGTLR